MRVTPIRDLALVELPLGCLPACILLSSCLVLRFACVEYQVYRVALFVRFASASTLIKLEPPAAGLNGLYN